MNNILLTREALNPIYHEAVKAFKLAVKRGEEIEEDFAPFVNEYCCRAQVRKVVNVMYDEVVCPLCYRLNPHHATENNGRGCNWCQDKEDWLRAAAEEVK